MNLSRTFYRWPCLLTACVALGHLFWAGCGDGRPKRISVSGRVLIDGKPLETGVVRAFPKGNRAASGIIGSDGRFTLTTFDPGDGCVLGKHPVTVAACKNLSQTATQWLAPKKYSSTATSGLTIDVTGPRDDVEIKLTWDGGKPFIEHFEPELRPGAKKK
jgi:hypothetical protein